MKKFFPGVIRRSTRIIFNKAVCLNLALVMLFNLATPGFAAATQNKQEEERLFQELNQELQAAHAKQTSSPLQNFLDLCVKNNDKNACDKYIAEVNKMFTTTAEETTKGNEAKEEVFKPISHKEYTKEFNANVQKEVDENSKQIRQEYTKQIQLLENRYKGIGINSPKYADYISEKSTLNTWQKESLQALTDWQNEILADNTVYYQEYLKNFENSIQEYKRDKEEALNDFLRETAEDTMAVYKKASDKSKLKLVPVFVYLLSMESPKARLLTKEQRSEIYRFFNKVISPSNKSNPCAFRTRDRKSNELDVYNSWQAHLNRMEEETRGTLSARDQVAAQTRGYEQRISNELKAPITEFVDEGACKAAMSALTGLSYFKGWDMSQVAMFMTKNAMEPMASEVLLMGTETLIETHRLDALSILALYMIDMEMTYEDADDLKLKESFFYDGRFYKTPYIASRYSEQDGGGDVWQDIAQMLSNDKTVTSKQIQEGILDRAVYFSVGNGKITFNHNLPFVYGLLLHNPKLIDNFVPSSALAFSYDTYSYKGKTVYFQYNDENVSLYIKEKGKEPFYLGDNIRIDNMATNTSLTVADVRKEAYKKYMENLGSKRAAYFKYFREQRGNLKPSAVFAEAFYTSDFIDLTLQEKLAMDKALEERYPHLKTLSKKHKQKVERNRVRADRVSGGIMLIDIALTLWFASDIYKGIKWGIKGVKAIRQLFTAGKAVKGLSDAKRIAFLRTFAKKNPDAVKLNRKLNRVKTMPQRMRNNFPKYKANVKTKINNFNEFMAKTGDYMGAPSGMQGQRVAVQTYNAAIGVPRTKGFYSFKYAKAASKAKVAGPINILDKKLRVKNYNDIKFNEEGFLEIDGDLFKTYKATMKADDIYTYNALVDKTIANLEKELELNKDRIEFLAREYKKADSLSEAELIEYEKFKNMAKNLKELTNSRYVTFRFNDVEKLTVKEKWAMHESGHTLLPIYNEEGKIISQVSLDNALKSTQNLIKEVENGKKIVLKNGKIYLGSEVLNVTVGVSKSTISLLGRSGAKVEDLSFISLRQKRSKMPSLIFNNALTFSAASTSLNLSLAKAPFSITEDKGNPHYVSQWVNTGLSVAVPYALSFLSPMFAPFVKRYGASRTQVFSLGIAFTGMTVASLGGYRGFATKKRDENGKLIYDKDGKTITADKAPVIWPLWIAAATSGVSSSLTRASLNIAINRYQVSKATMATSMVAKNIGSLFMTIIPAVADASFQHHRDNLDFSISYPVLAGLSIVGASLMLRNIPSSVAREADYFIMPNKVRSEDKLWKFWKWEMPSKGDWADMGRAVGRPFNLIIPKSAKSKTIIPYYLSFMSFGATESYALFKVYNSFSRDTVENFTEGSNFTGNDNKLVASLVATLPSALVRGLWKRKGNFSQGIFNNILFTSAGMVLLLTPSDNLSRKENIALGLTSGIMLGVGTANMYQYLQKNMLRDVVSDMSLVREYEGISALKTTAQSAYAGANIGLALPLVYTKVFAEKYKKDEEDGQYSADFKANQRVLPIAFGVYGLGIIPLFKTPFKADIITPIVNKTSRFTPLVSAPLGIFAINDLLNFKIRVEPLSKREPIKKYTIEEIFHTKEYPVPLMKTTIDNTPEQEEKHPPMKY